MYCRHCGKQISDDSSFCQYCGSEVIQIEGRSDGHSAQGDDVVELNNHATELVISSKEDSPFQVEVTRKKRIKSNTVANEIVSNCKMIILGSILLLVTVVVFSSLRIKDMRGFVWDDPVITEWIIENNNTKYIKHDITSFAQMGTTSKGEIKWGEPGGSLGLGCHFGESRYDFGKIHNTIVYYLGSVTPGGYDAGTRGFYYGSVDTESVYLFLLFKELSNKNLSKVPLDLVQKIKEIIYSQTVKEYEVVIPLNDGRKITSKTRVNPFDVKREKWEIFNSVCLYLSEKEIVDCKIKAQRQLREYMDEVSRTINKLRNDCFIDELKDLLPYFILICLLTCVVGRYLFLFVRWVAHNRTTSEKGH